jgi:NADPH:quinone reductase-like Zn-dependent oxidoreductase
VIAGVLKRQIAEAKAIGADGVVVLDDLESLSTFEPVDAVADTIGDAVMETLIGKVKDGGIFASVLAAPSAAAMHPKVEVTVMRVASDPTTLVRMANAVKDRKLTIPLGRRFALKDAAKAHAAAEGNAPGKLLLVA